MRYIKYVLIANPKVVFHLKGLARFFAFAQDRMAYKTYDYFLDAIIGLVTGVYEDNVHGEFIDVMANLISGQLLDAYERAWSDEGNEGVLPDYLQASLESLILDQYEHVDQYFRDITDARIDGTSLDPLLTRAGLWAGQWNTAYQNAVTAIAVENGEKLIWQEGDTIDKCDQCLGLDGIVAYAWEWQALGVAPRNFPNDKLDCKGGHCQCTLGPTDQRRSPKAFTTIMNIVTK